MEYNEKITACRVLQGDASALDWGTVKKEPSALFYDWLEHAIQHEVTEPQVMTLATADAQGRIATRVLLLKHVDDHANFYFSTSRINPAGKHLSENPYASLNFYWKELSQQIIVNGRVESCSPSDSSIDFHKRSIDSRAICLMEKQSEPLETIEAMHSAVDAQRRMLASNPTLLNPNWTLFRVIPDRIEFFQGRKTRMHERLAFTRTPDNGWTHSFIWA